MQNVTIAPPTTSVTSTHNGQCKTSHITRNLLFRSGARISVVQNSPPFPFPFTPFGTWPSIFKPSPQPVTIERNANLRRVSEWLAATLEMWCPARGCEFESRALRFEKSAHVNVRGLPVEMPRQIIANSAAVATGHPLGAAAGLEVLQAGGNAIDAAVASMLAMCVVVPGSVGLGGYGGSAVIYFARTGETVAVDFDSRAPLAFREGLVTADPKSNYYGATSVT